VKGEQLLAVKPNQSTSIQQTFQNDAAENLFAEVIWMLAVTRPSRKSMADQVALVHALFYAYGCCIKYFQTRSASMFGALRGFMLYINFTCSTGAGVGMDTYSWERACNANSPFMKYLQIH
jgi:hypothetical protein